MGFSWNTPNSNKKKSQVSQAKLEEKKFQVGDDVFVTYDPTGKHDERGGIILEVLPENYYMVNFTATSGASLDGEVRKPYQRKNGKRVVLTSIKEKVHSKHIKPYKY